jgi:Raf kinase inhibitor-like YbhB/YbcL family protein
MTRKLLIVLMALALLTVFGCAPAATDEPAAEPAAAAEATDEPVQTESAETAVPESTEEQDPAEFAVTSAGIVDGVMDDAFGMRGTQLDGYVPTRSLPLSVANAPQGTACLALSMIDPDGGDWVHWLAVNVPVGDLAENASIDLAETFMQGENDFGTVGYGGPTPPSGVHTYVIRVYALSETVSLEEGFSLDAFTQAIGGKILAETVLTGDYSS